MYVWGSWVGQVVVQLGDLKFKTIIFCEVSLKVIMEFKPSRSYNQYYTLIHCYLEKVKFNSMMTTRTRTLFERNGDDAYFVKCCTVFKLIANCDIKIYDIRIKLWNTRTLHWNNYTRSKYQSWVFYELELWWCRLDDVL